MNNQTISGRKVQTNPQPRVAVLVSLALLCAACGSGSVAQEVKMKKEARDRVRPVTVSSVAPEPVTMPNVNKRWAGARCQIRAAVEIKKDRDGAGWSKSDWLKAPVLPGEKEIKIRFLVSNRDLLIREGHLRRNKELRPGTAFIATGWRFVDEKKQKGIVIDLRFESLPIEARLEFKGPEKLEDLEDAEQMARFELFQLHEGSQQLGGAPGSISPSIPAEPSLSIVSAAVEPKVATRGSELELLITYNVAGGDQNGVPVNETRELRLGNKVVGVFNDTKTRVAGYYTSAHKIQVTRAIAPGKYTFRASISAGGKSNEATAYFEIR